MDPRSMSVINDYGNKFWLSTLYRQTVDGNRVIFTGSLGGVVLAGRRRVGRNRFPREAWGTHHPGLQPTVGSRSCMAESDVVSEAGHGICPCVVAGKTTCPRCPELSVQVQQHCNAVLLWWQERSAGFRTERPDFTSHPWVL